MGLNFEVADDGSMIRILGLTGHLHQKGVSVSDGRDAIAMIVAPVTDAVALCVRDGGGNTLQISSLVAIALYFDGILTIHELDRSEEGPEHILISPGPEIAGQSYPLLILRNPEEDIVMCNEPSS